jgi:homoserine kinase
MVEAVTRDPELLRVALHDRLHERVRIALVPRLDEVVDDLRRHNVPVCVSGAGPTLLAFPLAGSSDVADRLRDLQVDWKVLALDVRTSGYEVFDG